MEVEDIYTVALGKGNRPDHWQRQFSADSWPEVLIAPTGSGKTAGVTLGWAAHRMRSPQTTPRRLVWCLPMRSLVEQTAKEVRKWFCNLDDYGLGSEALPKPADVHILMGGVEAARWLDHVERPAVIVGTQDMLLSRALMRGYASSRAIWPMEFALLHQDTQWVFDEVQLMGAGRATSAQLEAFRRLETEQATKDGWAAHCSTRSLWISATLDPNWLKTVDFPVPTGDAVKQVDPGAVHDDRLRRLATAPKLLTRTNVKLASLRSPDIKIYIEELAEAVADAHRPGSMTLAIVNQVERAQRLHAAITKNLKWRSEKDAPQLALVHGRFRLADRQREMAKLVASKEHESGLIVVATQAVEAGVDISATVLFTELAPWPSMVQRFGRANRYAELDEGADVRWIDLLANVGDDKQAESVSRPYSMDDLKAARERLHTLKDVAAIYLDTPGSVDPPLRVIRRKDLDDLFDTDPDLTGFDVDISPYVRDADDTDVRVFWRDLSDVAESPLHPQAEELCAVPIGPAKDWLKKVSKRGEARVFYRDPQWRRGDGQTGTGPPGWTRLIQDPWPGLTLLAELSAGGYWPDSGFTGDPKQIPDAIALTEQQNMGGESEGLDEDPRSEIGLQVALPVHLRHVEEEADRICKALDVDSATHAAVVRAARWHDVGKAHDVFQGSMRRGLDNGKIEDDVLLAKTVKSNMRHERPYFRHELASALALLSHEAWSRDADLIAYLVAAHHGKVRMNLRALPRERAPSGQGRAGDRFARGVWENDELPPVDVGDEKWGGGRLSLSVMELGWDDVTRESWTERTRELLKRYGPFRLSWMEALVRLADWRASRKEQEQRYVDI